MKGKQGADEFMKKVFVGFDGSVSAPSNVSATITQIVLQLLQNSKGDLYVY